MDFNNAAKSYDVDFTHTEVGKMQRALVYDYLEKINLESFNNVLELNCGTGEDAIWLSQFCNNILATDYSAEMIKLAQKKNQASKVEYQTLDINNLDTFQNEKFDFVFSNFGGLNCLSPNQQKKFAENLRKLLKPNGVFIGVYMSRFSWIETLYFLLKFNLNKAFRRFNRTSIKVLVEGSEIETWYYSPSQLESIFKQKLKFISKKPIGFIVPPSYINPLFVKLKFWNRKALSADRGFFNKSLFSNGADHFLIHFENSL